MIMGMGMQDGMDWWRIQVWLCACAMCMAYNVLLFSLQVLFYCTKDFSLLKWILRLLQRSWRDLRNLFLLEHCCREERNLEDGGGIQPNPYFDEYTNTLDAWSSFLREEGTLSINMNDGFWRSWIAISLLYRIHAHHWLESSGIILACECLFYHLLVRIISTLKNNMMNVCSLHWFKRFNTKPRLFLTLIIRKYIDVILFNFFFIIYKNDFTIFNFL